MSRPQRAARLLLIRHGEAAGNRELVYLGRTDAALTARGREQARDLARSPLVSGCTAIYSSPLLRALDTARALAEVIARPVTVYDDLREMDFGAWEQLTRAEAMARDAARIASWEAGNDIAPPDGEPLSAVYARAVAVADALAARHPGEEIALVSHVGPIKALVCASIGLPPAGAQRMWLDPASICVVDWWASSGAGKSVLRIFNSTAHLGQPPAWQER